MRKPKLWLWVSCAGALVMAPAAQAATHSQFEHQTQLVRENMVSQPAQALRLANQAQTVASQEASGEARELDLLTARWLGAEAMTRLGRSREARTALDPIAHDVQRLAPSSKLMGDVLKSRARAEGSTGDVQSALADFQQAFGVYQHLGDARSQAITLQEIGSIYADARDYAHVLQYYAQAQETYGSDPGLNLTTHNNRGFAFKDMHRLAEAAAELRLARTAAAQMQSPYLEAAVLANIAWLDAEQGKVETARSDLAHGFSLARNDPEASTQIPFLTGVKARMAFDAGDVMGAVKLLDRMFAGVDLQTTTSEFRDFHELAAKVYERAGDRRKALQQLKAFMRLDSEGRALAASTNAALMSARFDFANQSLKIANLKAAQEQARARFISTLAALSSGAGLIVMGLVIFAFINMRRSRNRIRAVNTQLGLSNTALEKALKAKTEFLATTSHEIRTPLNGILGMTQVMLADERLAPETRERLRVVRAAGDTMCALVNDLLDVAKMETGVLTVNKAPLDLHRLLRDASQMWADKAATKGLEFKLDATETPARIVEDGDRLRQVIFNLLSNAVKFTEVGEVRVGVTVDSASKPERLRISVSDTGIGISADHLQTIFESFTQVDGGKSRLYGGTGLGLTICRQVVTALGGEVHVESAPGKGSTFLVDLPLERDESPEQADAKLSVVVLEDNPLSKAMIKTSLEAHVKALHFVASMDDLLHALATTPFDRIVVDATWLAKKYPDAPMEALTSLGPNAGRVIALWPKSDKTIRDALQAAGVFSLLEKPFPTDAWPAALNPTDRAESPLAASGRVA